MSSERAKAPAVELIGIDKRFGALQALDSVDLRVESGTIHAIVGENGAGKTTLMRILFGALRADSGSVRMDGKEVAFRTPAEAIRAGVGMVSQHYAIIPELTCLENLILGSEPGAAIDERSCIERAQRLATTMGFEFEWNHSAEHLSPGSAQKLEILKLLWRSSRILILDEPTAMLSPADGDALFESLKRLTADGATVLLVTHRLPEVIQHCESVTVLRAGKVVAALPVDQIDAAQLAEMIVGHSVEPVPERTPPQHGEIALELRSLTVHGARGDTAVREAVLEVRAGEVVGIAGVDGNGQRELVQALLGLQRSKGGTIELWGRDVTKIQTKARIAAGMRVIPEDRHEEGVVEDWSLEENAAIGLQRLSPMASGAWVDGKARLELAGKMAERFGTHHSGLKAKMRSLSGGNQQRFVAGRALQIDPKFVVAFQPARGLDIDATRHVYDAIREMASAGGAALIVSFDLDELLQNCDRIVVMHAGKLVEPDSSGRMDRAAIGRLMVGAT